MGVTDSLSNEVVVVTGVRGFIGSHIAKELTQSGFRVVGTDLTPAAAVPNVTEYLTAAELLQAKMSPTVVIHMGANANTMDHDRDRMMAMNYEYSTALATWAADRGARFIYASSAAVYGLGEHGFIEDVAERRLRPLNVYGESKLRFDRWMARGNDPGHKWMGLRFFNVFGPDEDHKGPMASMVHQIRSQVLRTGHVRLFKSYHAAYGDGEQRRDYVYVRDVVGVVLWAALECKASGVVNVGSGVSTTFNEVVQSVCGALGRSASIEYIDMPEELRPRYQYETRADLEKLRRLGCGLVATPVSAAVEALVKESGR